MNPRSKEIVKEMYSLEPRLYMDAGPHQNRQTALMGELLVILAEEQEKSSAKMEKQTDKIVRLTWALFWLTLALVFVAAVQLYIMLK
jgi:hypothetical protein